MKRTLIFYFLLLSSTPSFCQNLVLNGDFEGIVYHHQGSKDPMYNHCQSAINVCYKPLVNVFTQTINSICFQMPHWKTPSITSGYFAAVIQNTKYCYTLRNNTTANETAYFAISEARSGNYIIYLTVFAIDKLRSSPFLADTNQIHRDFVQTRLRYPLRKGCKYRASCYVKLYTNLSLNPSTLDVIVFPEYIGCDGFGMYFSKDSIKHLRPTNFFQYKPQVSNPDGNIITDTANYTLISGEFVAQGGEEYLTLGNFKTNNNTKTFRRTGIDYATITRFALDDISVEPIDDVPSQPLSLGMPPINFCKPFELKSKGDFDKYVWSNGDTSQTTTIATPGKYWIQATKGKCYTDWDSIEVIDTRKPPEITKSKTTFNFCEEPIKPFRFGVPNAFSSFLWNNGSTTNMLTIKEKGLYIVDATYPCGVVTDTVEVIILPVPSQILTIANDTILCNQPKLEVATLKPWAKYSWSNGSENSSIAVLENAMLRLNVENSIGCRYKDSVNISFYKDLPKDFIPTDTLFCNEQPLVINNPTPSNCSVLVNNFSTPYKIDNSGVYVIQTKNPCFIRIDTIKVHLISCTYIEIPNLVTANNDLINDHWQIKTDLPRAVSVEIYDRWGIRQFVSHSYQNNWPTENTSPDVYYYHLFDQLNNKPYKGWVQVVR